MVDVGVEVDDDLQVRLSLSARAAEETEDQAVMEEPMAFKVGVIEGSDGGLPRLSIEMDGTVVASFEQTEQGRQDFWNYMDTIRVAEATSVADELGKMKLEPAPPVE